MSYDLTIAALRDGEGLEDAYSRVMETDLEEGEQADEPPVINVGQMVAEIVKAAPMLTDDGGGGLRNDAELNDLSQPGTGLQVTVRPDQVWIAVPYWHHGEMANRVFRVIRQVCASVERQGRGMRTFDAQIGRVVDWERDQSLILEAYEGVVGRMANTGNSAAKTRPAKRWWEFWK
jgi:hypothetical protein